jgi:cell wall-associated NlpC family hydrolase
VSPLILDSLTAQAGAAGMASGAQLFPLAQHLATQISQGLVAMPSTNDGWKNLVAQFTTNAQKLDLNGSPILKDVGAPFSNPATAPLATLAQAGQGATSPAAGPGADAVDQFLASVKQHESGGNYKAYNAGGGASGAYQYIDSTWAGAAKDAGFGQYAGGSASSAPPDVQDAVARHMALSYYNQYGSWKNAAEAWYMPSMAGNAADQNTVPYPSAGNTETIGKYGDQIVAGMGGQPANNGANLSLPTPGNLGSGSAVTFARSALGTPYAWGGESGAGYDCSGLTQAAYANAGVNLPRVAQDQYNATMKVPQGQQLQAGDLVFFGQNTSNISHVGIYIGNGKMIDAPNPGSVVRTENYNWADYVGATRPTDHTGLTTLPTSVPVGSNTPTTGKVLGNYNAILSQTMAALNSSGAR